MRRKALYLTLSWFCASALLCRQSAAQAPPTAVLPNQFESAPSAAQVRALLQSSEPRSQAWGAWWTAQEQLSGMEPLLQKNLEEHYLKRTLSDESVMDTTLDAYIQSSASAPPPDLLKAIYPIRPSQSLILFSRLASSPSVDSALMELLRSEAGKGAGEEWFAIANLLLAHRAPGFAFFLLQDLKLTGLVSVCDPGNCNTPPWPPVAMGIGGEGMLPPNMTPGLPPWPAYRLTPVLQGVPPRSVTMLSSGPVAIAYRRWVGSPGLSPSEMQSSYGWQAFPPHPTSGDRLKYLTAAAPSFTMPVSEYELLQIPWQGVDDFMRKVTRLRDDIRQHYALLVQQMKASGMLSDEEAAKLTGPVVDFAVNDFRSIKTPLPEPQSR